MRRSIKKSVESTVNYLTVVGIDLSLNGTGVVILPHYWQPGDWNVRSLFVGQKLKNDAIPLERVQRLQYICDEIIEFIQGSEFPDEIFIEEYPFAQLQSHSRSIAELGGCIKLACFEKYKKPIQPVHSATWRKYLLGFGTCENIKEIAQAEIRLAGGKFKTGDECDALGVANAGRALTDQTFLSLNVTKPPSKKKKMTRAELGEWARMKGGR